MGECPGELMETFAAVRINSAHQILETVADRWLTVLTDQEANAQAIIQHITSCPKHDEDSHLVIRALILNVSNSPVPHHPVTIERDDPRGVIECLIQERDST
jgi:hypothetical protein